ncbi:acyloxyacyl hydrolase [Leptobacterium sp. I13]|uniref:acyloxyacyl hydrolase n=1 Tax=Leptobacterium meishanense TaxID=3128904 RepID=UPI0030EB46DE
MCKKALKITIPITLFFLTVGFSQVNDEKLLAQFSPFLSKTYFNFNLGGIFYPFSNTHLAEGYSSDDIRLNPFSGRFLLGYKFNEDLAIQFGVTRPAAWVKYKNINGRAIERSVWINIWSLSLKRYLNFNNRLSIYGEAGLGNLTRVGFSVGDDVVYPDAHYITPVFGAGIKYTLNKKWDFLLNSMYVPSSTKHNQPYIFQQTVGLLYNLKQIPKEQAKEYTGDSGYFFPKRFIQVGYGSSSIGFFANRFFSMDAKIGNFDSFGIPIFWHGDSRAANTFMISYQQTAFHTKKTFSLDWGVSITGFQTIDTNTNVFALSVFPVLRFYVLRKSLLDMYLNYSVIGPAYISKKNIDGFETGPNLTYQDFMGIGAFVGKKRRLNIELKIMHYSNGNLFTENAGVAIPLMINIGRTF